MQIAVDEFEVKILEKEQQIESLRDQINISTEQIDKLKEELGG